MQLDIERVTILCGHSGVGKTNLALNLARWLAQGGEAVTLIDLDIVNPYFRSSDYGELLAQQGINVIAPQAAGTTLDLPALSGAVAGALNLGAGRVLLDVGGDELGATALGRFAPTIQRLGAYTMLCVINRHRAQTQLPQQAAALIPEMEQKSRLRFSALLNNSHLAAQTSWEQVEQGLAFAKEVASLTGLPLLATTVPDFLVPQHTQETLWPVHRWVKNPWEE